MSFYLLDHPNPHARVRPNGLRGNYYTSRQKPIQFIVLHTAENLPDFSPPDMGAESVANYGATTTRTVSWHSTIDSDSIIPMLPDDFTAFHVQGYNSPSLGIEMATQAHKWLDSPYGWRIKLLNNVANEVAIWCRQYKLPVKLRDKAQIDAGLKGITFHSYLDPTRRSDPGAAFPYPYLLERVASILSPETGITNGTLIMGDAVATIEQAMAWARAKGAHRSFLEVIPLYYQIGPELGVRADGAIAQAAKETNLGHFTGVIPGPHFNNWCGLKTADAAGDRVQDHAQFATPAEGVRAHLEHLSLYAGTPVPNPVDPRHFAWISGRAKTFEALGGENKWAPAENYGTTLVQNFLTPMTVIDPVIEDPGDDKFNEKASEIAGLIDALGTEFEALRGLHA